jgi:predicted transcriptional regulator
MPELLEWDELKSFFDPRLIKAISHPVRAHIFAVFNERIASGSEIGEELNAEVSSFYHHVETLQELGCIELVETKRRRGAQEHFFRARRTVFFDDEAWRQLPASLKDDLATSFMQAMFDEIVAALKAETLNTFDDEHVSWTPGRFDARGWCEAKELVDETLERLAAIQRESAERLARDGEPGIPATFAILGFKTAQSSSQPPATTQ